MAEDETNIPEKDPNQEQGSAAPETVAQTEENEETTNGADVPVREPPPPDPPPSPDTPPDESPPGENPPGESPPEESPPGEPPSEVPKEEPSDPPTHKHSPEETSEQKPPLLSAKEMDDIEVTGEVVIYGGVFKLGDLAGLRVGSMVEIDAAELSSSRFVVGGGLFAEGELVRPSKSDDKIALKITKLADKD